jgi:uncharacterized membrane protein (UPF0127 family)
MKKILIVILGLILLLIFINFPFNKNDASVTIKGKTFIVDVAKTDYQKQKGLSIYKEIPEDKGMIFIFSKQDYYNFWMKDMKFPIDIIYIKDNKIVDIFENVLPPNSPDEKLEIIRPEEKADKVLEINANLSNKYNFKKGDLININI